MNCGNISWADISWDRNISWADHRNAPQATYPALQWSCVWPPLESWGMPGSTMVGEIGFCKFMEISGALVSIKWQVISLGFPVLQQLIFSMYVEAKPQKNWARGACLPRMSMRYQNNCHVCQWDIRMTLLLSLESRILQCRSTLVPGTLQCSLHRRQGGI